MNISILGLGSWGTALGTVLANNGHTVLFQGSNREVVNDINYNHRNSKYLNDTSLNENIRATTSIHEALDRAEMLLIAVPSHAMREVARTIKSHIKNNITIVHATKGIETDTFKTMSEVLAEELGSEIKKNIVVLTGPSHAEEVALKLPTTLVSVSSNFSKARETQIAFMNEYIRVYTGDDIIGAELGGSLKNIIALAAGLSDGLGYGDNMKAALLTRGLSEMIRIGESLGAKPSTFTGLTGIGDLIVTGTSKHSRNWKTGNLLAKGLSLEEALQEIGMVSEGVKSTKSAYFISKELEIVAPITEQLYLILFKGKNPEQATKDLMTREYKNE